MKPTEAESKNALYSSLAALAFVVAFIALVPILVFGPILRLKTEAMADLSRTRHQMSRQDGLKLKTAAEQEQVLRSVNTSMTISGRDQPTGASIAWVPAQLTKYFKSRGVGVGKFSEVGKLADNAVLLSVEVADANCWQLLYALNNLRDDWPTIGVVSLDLLGHPGGILPAPRASNGTMLVHASAKLTLAVLPGTLPVENKWIPDSSGIRCIRVPYVPLSAVMPTDSSNAEPHD